MKTSYLFVLFLFATTFAAVVNTYVDEQGRNIDHHVGTYMVKDVKENLYRVTYDVEMLGGFSIMNIDQVKGVRRVQCDISDIEMVVNFNSVPDAYSFYKTVTASASDRFVTGSKWNCSDTQSGSFILLRRVIEAEISGVTVILRTSQGSYEDLFKEGNVRLESAEAPDDYSKTVCLGVNTNAECDAANRALPLYQNKYVTVSCSNCFVGAKATVFLDFSISWFKLRHVGAGLKDININGAFVLDMAAEGSASGALDKTYRVVDQALIVQFFIGPVPVVIWYEVPLRLVANAMVTARAHASAGAKANWKIGDAFVEWDEKTGWKVAKPQPVFNWEKVLEGEASFSAEASISIIPSIVLHAMKIVSATVRIEPTLMASAYGDTTKKELCADMSYKVLGDFTASIGLNMPIGKLLEKEFGPYEIFNTGVKPIGHWCIKK